MIRYENSVSTASMAKLTAEELTDFLAAGFDLLGKL